MAKPKYVRTLRPEEYRDALFTHGRRVANRLVLASLPLRGRVLSDFYACYAPEGADGERTVDRTGDRPSTDLPERERCVTGLIRKFDPSGWFAHYPDKPPAQLWPDPQGDDATADAISKPPRPDEEVVARQLAADIAHSARQVISVTSRIDDENERDERGNAMLSTLASALSAKYGHGSSHEIYNAIVDEVNK